ncbi:MAG: NAD(P)-dependent oxidoreductase [Oscillibacter sp.]|jgi:nucleoside-diphosphate-sugar epimerase|nr:NAD(P)-dependent oxidoreductase [Oscillibacter sp.]
MKRAIVSGAAGFVGSAVVAALEQHGVEVCAVVPPDFATGPKQFRLERSQATIVECDLRDYATLDKLLPWDSADVFYQLAWEGLSPQQITDWSLQLENVGWNMNAIVVAAKLGCKAFIGAGTISQDELATAEGRRYQQDRHRVFRVAAQSCEDMGRSVAMEQGISFFWPIISNVYGEGERMPRLVTNLCKSLLRGESVALSAGTQLYDFIYRSDAGEAFYRIGEYGKEGRRYNISSGDSKPLKEYLSQLRDVVAPDSTLEFGARPFAGIPLPKESFDITALTEDTGFLPAVSFQEGVARVRDWLTASQSQP